MPALAPNVGDASSEPGNVPPIVGRELSKGLPALCAEARQAIAPSKMSVSVTRIISHHSRWFRNYAQYSYVLETARIGVHCDIKKLLAWTRLSHSLRWAIITGRDWTRNDSRSKLCFLKRNDVRDRTFWLR